MATLGIGKFALLEICMSVSHFRPAHVLQHPFQALSGEIEGML